MEIDAVVFDYDGTLVHLNIDFDAMRSGLDRLMDSSGLDHRSFGHLHMLEAIDRADRMLSKEDRVAGRTFRKNALKLLRDEEVKAAGSGKILSGVVTVLKTLRDRGVKVGIITRNCDEAVRIAFPKIEQVCDVFIPRDNVVQVKPHPVHMKLALKKMAVRQPDRCLMVGDHVIDIEAGKRVGMRTAGVLTGNTSPSQFLEAGADYVLEDATKVLDRIRSGQNTSRRPVFRSGKLDMKMLDRLLRRYGRRDPRVLIGPRIGEDTAAIGMGNKLLIVTTDPVTFATEEIGYYSVVVNANDVATSGAQPKWFTVNMLLPEHGTDEAFLNHIFQQIHKACEEFDISLVGGHTEITHGLPRPILVGHMMGEVEKGALVRTAGAQVGDDVLLSKGICIEGTSVIAREREEMLVSRGISRKLIQRAQGFLYDPGISVIREARLACETGRVHSMHDVTEGGLANGLHEIAAAACVEIVVEEAKTPLFAETRTLCEVFDIDPWGLIASGALLITAAPEDARKILACASHEGLDLTRIGSVREGKPSVSSITAAGKKPVPYFARDELVKVFESQDIGEDRTPSL